jgi:hypothetical protein
MSCKLITLFHITILSCDTKLVDVDTDLYNVVTGNLQFTSSLSLSFHDSAILWIALSALLACI